MTDLNKLYYAAASRSEAAHLIHESYPSAFEVEFAVPGWIHGQRASVYTLRDADGLCIWASTDEHADQLLRQDDITERLAEAQQLAPSALREHHGAWVMNVPGEMAAAEYDAVQRVTAHMCSLPISLSQIERLVYDLTGSVPYGEAPDARFRLARLADRLVAVLGERGAWRRLDRLVDAVLPVNG